MDSLYPGPINNSDIILLDGITIKKNLFEGIDYVFLPEFLGKYLYEIYGGEDLILRKVQFIF